MLHGSPWCPPDDVKQNVQNYVNEVARILKPGGRWIYFTYRQPHFMKPMLKREGVWEVTAETVENGPGTFEYFGYLMIKNQPG